MRNKLSYKERVALDVKTLKIVHKILMENPEFKDIFEASETYLEVRLKLRQWLLQYFEKHPNALSYYLKKSKGIKALRMISWRDYAAIRLMDYLNNEGKSFTDPNRNNRRIVSQPIRNLWLAIQHGKGSASIDFFIDMLYLFRQLNGKLSRRIPGKQQVIKWMGNHPSGLDEEFRKIREANKERILRLLIKKIDQGEYRSSRYQFAPRMDEVQKYKKALEWWQDYRFHLSFAVRSPEELNEMLDYSLREETLNILNKARKKGIPIFVNPYYLSLISVDTKPDLTGADRALRDYILPNRELVEEFGNIHAWEKEDIVQPGETNAAGWILPPYPNVHRRYPEVAIFIPDTAGRACGGLCVSCQRMYDFQSGRFNFHLAELTPKISWPEKMKLLLEYWEHDPQLRDILITGGDALMSTDKSLKRILDEIYAMAVRKKEANIDRPSGEKYAEIVRVRLGTRLPVYLPQRITPELVEILADFRKKASGIGIRQLIIQTHIESAMEVTPLVKRAVERLNTAGWIVTNQLVFTAASSIRGHTVKLRKVLNDIGIIPYYTFTVKGFMENYHNFATNERSVQERTEEKYIGNIPKDRIDKLAQFHEKPEKSKELLSDLRKELDAPFLATDRSVLNMPGVGKSMTYRTIGITDDGRRILEFEHDTTRNHSPIVAIMGNVVIIESKSINNYLKQMDEMGEDPEDYQTIWGYSMNDTEAGIPVYHYPEYGFKITGELKNFMSEPFAFITDELISAN